jgi:enoyl-CoA hydratase/carnithine racemase
VRTGSAHVEVALRGHVALLTLSNSERRNVMDVETATAMQEAVERLGRDPHVRCVVIAGSDGVFASGADIRELDGASATGGLARLPILVPRTVAAELALTGELISGAEAKELGLVNAAVPPDEVLDRALELAEKIAKVAPLSAQAIVESLRRDANLPIADANLRVEDRLAALLCSHDRREGARAFLERREPEFEGL